MSTPVYSPYKETRERYSSPTKFPRRYVRYTTEQLAELLENRAARTLALRQATRVARIAPHPLIKVAANVADLAITAYDATALNPPLPAGSGCRSSFICGGQIVRWLSSGSTGTCSTNTTCGTIGSTILPAQNSTTFNLGYASGYDAIWNPVNGRWQGRVRVKYPVAASARVSYFTRMKTKTALQPLMQPLPLAPTTNPNAARVVAQYMSEPAPLPQPQPAPAYSAFSVGAGGINRVGTRTIAPPRKNEKETKLQSRLQQVSVAIYRALAGVSEVGDVVDAFFKALPEEVQAKWKRKKRGLTDNAGQYGINGMDWKLMAIYHNWHQLNYQQAMKNILVNELEDQFIGRASRAKNDLIRARNRRKWING